MSEYDNITREEIEAIVQEARKLIAAHERRSPSSRRITLGESDALFKLSWAIRQARERAAA